MTVLREIAARFDISVDTAPLGRLDTAIGKTKSSLGGLAFASTAALAALGASMLPAIEAASKAEEVSNKIEAIFGRSTRAEIEAWSKTVEQQMGRSEFAFQSSFSDFAAFLDPMGLGLEKTIEFSKQLSKLTVDLASFYNTSEEEARMRLFSGVSGEAEAVRRLGINISDASLAELFNSKENPLDARHRPGVSKGVKLGPKKFSSLSQEAKTQLRIYKIMKDTVKAQGDAARTAGGWANTLKRLVDRFHRLQIAIGGIAKGAGVKFLNLFEHIAIALETATSKTSSLQTAFVMLGGAAVLWTGRWAIANAGLIASYLPVLGVVAKLAAAFLVIEDFVTFFRNDENKSMFGTWVRSFEDIARPAQTLRNAIEDLPRAWRRFVDELRNSESFVTRNLTRTLDWWTSGKDVNDNSMEKTQTEAIREKAAKSREAQLIALKKGDVRGYTENRRLDQYEGEMLPSFLAERGPYVNANPELATEDDIASKLITREKVEAAKKAKAAAEAAAKKLQEEEVKRKTSAAAASSTTSQQITIAPHIEMKVDLGSSHDAGRYQLNDLKLAIHGILGDAVDNARYSLRRSNMSLMRPD